MHLLALGVGHRSDPALRITRPGDALTAGVEDAICGDGQRVAVGVRKLGELAISIESVCASILTDEVEAGGIVEYLCGVRMLDDILVQPNGHAQGVVAQEETSRQPVCGELPIGTWQGL